MLCQNLEHKKRINYAGEIKDNDIQKAENVWTFDTLDMINF